MYLSFLNLQEKGYLGPLYHPSNLKWDGRIVEKIAIHYVRSALRFLRNETTLTRGHMQVLGATAKTVTLAYAVQNSCWCLSKVTIAWKGEISVWRGGAGTGGLTCSFLACHCGLLKACFQRLVPYKFPSKCTRAFGASADGFESALTNHSKALLLIRWLGRLGKGQWLHLRHG